MAPARTAADVLEDGELFREWAEAGHIVLFDPWRWPTMRGMWAQDRFHPNDDGYTAIADQLWGALAEVVPGR